MTTHICPKCSTENSFAELTTTEYIDVRGEEIKLEVPILRCNACGEEYYNFEEDIDVLDQAYREYRNKHNMIQPEQLKSFRKEYGLTQHELANLLGWGGATISRYENGALQDEAHDKTLQLAMDPENLQKLILDKPNALSENKREKVLEKITQEKDYQVEEFSNYFEDRFGQYPPNEFSGYAQLKPSKVMNSILYLCSNWGEVKTKLNKLLFYAVFLHYIEYGSSITGAKYVRLPYGPVLDNYEFYLAALIHDDEALRIREIEYGEYVGEELTSTENPDLTTLSPSEQKILATIKDHFKNWTASDISEKAHLEEGFKNTKELDPISYEYAEKIKL